MHGGAALKTLAIIDADSLVYEATTSCEYEAKWTEDLWTLHSDLGEAKLKFDDMVSSILDTLLAFSGGEAQAVMTLSDYSAPWRRAVMPTYKENRKKVRKPIVFGPLRDYVHENYETFQRPGLEGDDVIGILLTWPAFRPEYQKVAVSIDKDMNTLPGLHLKLRTDAPFAVSLDQANRYHMRQALTGDTTDGYKGCPGMGPKTADKLLDATPPAQWWPAIVAAYAKAGLSEDVAIQNARVARILRYGDYDMKMKEVKLWQPPK